MLDRKDLQQPVPKPMGTELAGLYFTGYLCNRNHHVERYRLFFIKKTSEWKVKEVIWHFNEEDPHCVSVEPILILCTQFCLQKRNIGLSKMFFVMFYDIF